MDPGPDGIYLVIQLLILLLYILLSMAEAAAQHISVSRHRKAAEGEDVALTPTKEQAEILLTAPSAIRIGMMFLLLASFGFFLQQAALPVAEAVAGGWGKNAPALSFWLCLLLFTLVYLFVIQLLCSQLPRRLAMQKPRGMARRLFPIALFFHRVFRPLALLLEAIVNGLLALFKVEVMQPTEEITEDEIRMLVDVGEEKGAIEEAEREMIKNVFEFNNMTAAECMTHRTDVYAVWVDDSNEEIIALIGQTGLSRFPVYEEDLDHIIGTLFTREFLLNLQSESPLPLREIIREAHFVPETVRTDLLFRDMQRNKFHMAVVVDEYGGTSGLITMEDLLEEIVGNIYDEYDPQDQQEFEQLGENRWRVAGTLDVESFNELSGRSLPVNDEYDTVGGLILSQMNSIPEDGSQPEMTIDGLDFKVKSVSGRRIEWVEVSKPDGV